MRVARREDPSPLAQKLQPIVERLLVDVQRLKDVVGKGEGNVTAIANRVMEQRAELDQLSARVDELAASAEQGTGGLGQRDWFEVDDADAAVEWIEGLLEWHERVWVHLVGSRLPGCWPLHPGVVAEVTAVRDHYAEAMGGPYASAVTDLYGRAVVGAARRVSKLLEKCRDLGGQIQHTRLDGGGTQLGRDTVRQLVPEWCRWWTSGRDPKTEPPR